MTITLHDVAYQLGLMIDGDPLVAALVGGWCGFSNHRLTGKCMGSYQVIPYVSKGRSHED
ncbi:hypothetical protein AHAS_Ahas17G0109500 [Arachis hypogaea]